MTAETARQLNALLDEAANIGASPMEFEMAYQARVAIDRIRFAIRHTPEFGCCQSGSWCGVGLQLLDALERLESVDRRFQYRASERAPAQQRGSPGASASPSPVSRPRK